MPDKKRVSVKNKKPLQVEKRDGRIVDFSRERIVSGIFKAAESVGGKDRERAEEVADEVIKRINEKFKGVVKTKDIGELIS